MVFAGIISVTYFTDFLGLRIQRSFLGSGEAVPRWRGAAGGAGHHGYSVGGIDKVRHTLLGLVSLVVVAGVGLDLLLLEHL